jgi:hypothetical protein
MGLGALFGLAVIIPITSRVMSKPSGFLAWTRTIALLSLALTLVEGLAGPRAGTLNADLPFNFDPYMWVIEGGLGVWLLAVNLVAYRSAVWSRSLSVVGCIVGACSLAFPFAVFGATHGFVDFILELPLAVGIGILLPIWVVWMAASSPMPED